MKSDEVMVGAFVTRDGPYGGDLARLRDSAAACGYDFDCLTLEDRGSWQANCAQKPWAVLSLLERHRRPMLFLDADAWLKKRMPFLEYTRAEIALNPLWLHRINPQAEAVRYKAYARRFGCLWQSGVLFLRPTAEVRELVLLWLAFCQTYPWQWDQVSLQDAFAGVPRKPRYEALPAGYGAGGEYVGHESGFHRFAKGKTPRRILVLGSAPELAELVEKDVVREYLREGFWIAAVNNAWRLVGEDMNFWYHSTDFDDRAGRPQGDHFTENPSWQVQTPYWQGTRVLMPDLLCHLLNVARRDQRLLEVHVGASDFVYERAGDTHFYGAGGTDPLRFGGETLDSALRGVAAFYADAGAKIYRVGNVEGSRLPFPVCQPWDLFQLR